MIRARLSDATACFNLNSVVEGTGELWQRRESGSRQFTALLRALDVPQVQADGLVDRLVDWIDSHPAPRPAGAEDASFPVRAPPSPTGGALLAPLPSLPSPSASASPLYLATASL